MSSHTGAQTPLRPALVLALDGATLEVIEPLARAGRLPNLAAWMGAGGARPLPSTVPPMTFPAWSSFMTGLGPGGHGIFDFTQKIPGAYRVRFVHAGDRSGESLFARVSAAGGRVLVLGMPATHPPEPVNGLLVAGFDAPVSTGSDPSRASDPALYRRIAARAGPWMEPALAESADEAAWHERARDTLLDRIARKTHFTLAALDAMGPRPELAVVVFAESDTVAHHYWRDHDPDSPRHDPRASAARKRAVADVYAALDAACGEIRARFGEDAACFVVSDHGAGGASRRVVHLNRHLADCGLLGRKAGAASRLDGVARGARDAAVRALPPRLAQWAFRRARGAAARWESTVRFAGQDWARTAAFSEEANTQPGVWINLRGREAEGSVSPADYERVRRDVIDALTGWTLPGGDVPVVARARAREEVYRGPNVARAPDVVVELALEAGYAHSLVPTPWNAPGAASIATLEDDALAGARGRGMNGTHRPDGIWIATANPAGEAGETAGEAGETAGEAREKAGGAGETAATLAPASIEDAAPAIAKAMGLSWPAQTEGGGAARPAAPYTAEEEAQVAARLRALGYIE